MVDAINENPGKVTIIAVGACTNVALAIKADPERSQKLWDAQVPGIFFCPDLITETDVRDVAIETSHCYAYGESVTWKEGNGPDNSATCTIVYDLDGDAYWNMVTDLYSYVPAE